jgi:spore coat polysaccharide biosynthesis predicted glycosyltransferase SpsG
LITIFTEAGSKQGFGHLSRCCALYDESVALGYDTRLIVNTTEPLSQMPRNIIIANWLEISVLMKFLNKPDYVIVDSYLSDLSVYKIIADNCKTALYIDDYMRIDYPKGIVVNPSLYGDKMPYKQKNDVKNLGGKKYVIVRKEFQSIPFITRENKLNRILITMGGSDILNLTPIIIKSLSAIEKHVVLGQGFKNTEEIKSATDENTVLHYSLTAEQMRDLMLNVDVAVTAAGQTIYELMSFGIPMIPIKVIDNQKWNIAGLQELGIKYLDATEKDLNEVEWKELIVNARKYQPFVFNGQKEILKALREAKIK